MKKKIYVSISTLLFLVQVWVGSVMAQEKSIRDLMEEHFSESNLYIGSAFHWRNIETESEPILRREFNYVTPANDFKQSYIHPDPDRWRWDDSDAWVAYCKEHGQLLRLHGPISPQCSPWTKEDHRTAQELSQNLDEFMKALCERYNDEPHIRWMDVVNETIFKDGTWFGPREGTTKWENPWTIIGFDESVALRPPLYIKRAFQLSNYYAPNIKQIINQHGAFEEVVWEKMKELVLYLRGQGLRVDGVGWQAHIDLGWEKEGDNMKRLSDFVDWCHTNNLEFHITEFNVWLRAGDEGKYSEQSDTFREITELLINKQSTGVVGVNFWHLRGQETANPDLDGCPWTDDLTAKPFYTQLKNILAQESVTSIFEDILDKNNRAFYPNPVKNIINFKSDKALQKVVVKDLLGKTVFEFQSENIKQLDIRDIGDGVYMASLFFKDNTIDTLRFMKQH